VKHSNSSCRQAKKESERYVNLILI